MTKLAKTTHNGRTWWQVYADDGEPYMPIICILHLRQQWKALTKPQQAALRRTRDGGEGQTHPAVSRRLHDWKLLEDGHLTPTGEAILWAGDTQP